MPEYKLFLLDDAGKVIRCSVFEAPDHQDAVRTALELQDEGATELWCCGWRVRAFPASSWRVARRGWQA
jgi:hypothetical protein